MDTDDLRLRHYLLGMLPEEAQRACEAEYLASDDAFQAMLAAENELAYDYAQGVLSADERKRFEERFLQDPEHGRRIAVARGVLKQLQHPPPVRREHRAWLSPAIAWTGVAALVVLTVATAWLLSRTTRLERELASARTASAPLQPSDTSALQAELARERARAAALEKRLAATGTPDAPARTPLVVSTVLSAGRVRGEGEAAVVSLPSTTDVLRIQAVIDAPLASRLRGAVRNADGVELWSAVQDAGAPKDGRVTVAFDVPAPLLPAGDYELVLARSTPSGAFQALAEYDFRVSRPAASRR
jgi:hypothetical protein